MATTSLYKDTLNHRTRIMTTEDSFSKGMRVTNAPLDTAYARVMCNYDLKNDGEVLKTRAALKPTGTAVTFGETDVFKVIHSTGSANVESVKGTDKTNQMLHYVSMATEDPDVNGLVQLASFRCAIQLADESLVKCDKVTSSTTTSVTENLVTTTTVTAITVDGKTVTVTSNDTTKPTVTTTTKYKVKFQDKIQNVHDLTSVGSNYKRGVHSDIYSVMYVPVTKEVTVVTSTPVSGGSPTVTTVTTTSTCLSKFVFQIVYKLKSGSTTEYELDKYTWDLTEVTPKEIQPTQAVNYGYNMLKDNPYTFSNVQVTTAAVTLLGVVPYDEQGNILLSARAGTTITFKLFYKYPKTDKDNPLERYYTQWELYDLSNSSSSTTMIQDMTKSPVITVGNPISLSFSPTVKQFGLIVKLYKVSAINPSNLTVNTTAQLKSLIDAQTNLINPEQTITLASYYLLDDSNSVIQNLSTVEYALGTATGMCTWNQRVVLWGVKDAKNMLFVSEINSPDYFPYPNNVEIFNTDVVCAITYMSKLLVFTTTTLYLLTFNEDGLTYSSSIVQDRLSIEPGTQSVVQAIQNMVYFKSSNYYYMIVPKIQSLTGELQLAPISRPVEQLLDNLKESITDVLDTLYTITDSHHSLNVDCVDTWTVLANNQVRNMYKLRLAVTDDRDSSVVYTYCNFSVNYDTVLRAWSLYVFDSTEVNEVIFNTTATGTVQHLMVEGNKCSIIVEDAAVCQDSHKTTVKYPNYQLLDTGFRKHSEQYKKRYREVQFTVNALTEDKLKFYTSFNVDADERSSFYKYVVTHCTDKTDPNYGTIFVEREFVESVNTPSVTQLDGAWELDTSMFPELSVYKVRFKVSGKGYGGRVKILSMNNQPYELLVVSWVFRPMFAR